MNGLMQISGGLHMETAIDHTCDLPPDNLPVPGTG